MAQILKEITPTANNIVITYDKYTEEEVNEEIREFGIAKHNIGDLKEIQKVVSAGPMCRLCKKDTLIAFNPSHYAQKLHKDGSIKDGVIMDNPVVSYKFRTIDIDGKELLFANEQDVDFVVNKVEYKKLPTKSNVIIAKPDMRIIQAASGITTLK